MSLDLRVGHLWIFCVCIILSVQCLPQSERACLIAQDCTNSGDKKYCFRGFCSTQACVQGTVEPCFEGLKELQHQGVCSGGQRYCDHRGLWSSCRGQILPSKEICDRLDNNCDGTIDVAPALDCNCEKGSQRECYAGPDESLGKGMCKAGVQYCEADNLWGPCFAQVMPQPEICDQLDNDCNGQIDDGIDCSCKMGEQRPCYSGPANTQGRGICKSGTQSCQTNGVWGDCKGQILPQPELCNGQDDDCDGQIDGATLDCSAGLFCIMGKCSCPLGQERCGGACVTTNYDHTHCGACENTCKLNEFCRDGKCLQCVDAAVVCGNGCCPGGMSCCKNKFCIDLSNNAQYCGKCDKFCELTQTCCNGQCVALLHSPEHCGECGVKCNEQQTCCMGQCVDPKTSSDNCGSCNTICARSEICSDGKCVACGKNEDCAENHLCCNNKCYPYICPGVVSFQTPGSTEGSKIVSGKKGEIYVAGIFTQKFTITCNNQQVNIAPKSDDKSDIFIAKYVPIANTERYDCAWFKTAGGDELDAIYAMAIEGDHLYIAGQASRNFQFDGVTQESIATAEISVAFIAKLDLQADGKLLLFRTVGSMYKNSAFRDLVLDKGIAYVTGYFYSEFDLIKDTQETILLDHNKKTALLAKIDMSDHAGRATVKWFKYFNTSQADGKDGDYIGQAITLAPHENALYVTGQAGVIDDQSGAFVGHQAVVLRYVIGSNPDDAMLDGVEYLNLKKGGVWASGTAITAQAAPHNPGDPPSSTVTVVGYSEYEVLDKVYEGFIVRWGNFANRARNYPKQHYLPNTKWLGIGLDTKGELNLAGSWYDWSPKIGDDKYCNQIIIARYDAQLTLIGYTRIGTKTHDAQKNETECGLQVSDIFLDTQDIAYIAGSFEGILDFGLPQLNAIVNPQGTYKQYKMPFFWRLPPQK